MLEYENLRRQIARFVQIDESAIRPDTRMGAIIPVERRDEWIGQLRARTNQPVQVPGLSRRSTRTVRWIEFGMLTALGLLFWWQPLWITIAMLIYAWISALIVSQNESVRWPTGYETMEELAISQVHYNAEDAAAGLWPREEIAAKVRWIVAAQSGARFSEITEDTNLYDLC